MQVDPEIQTMLDALHAERAKPQPRATLEQSRDIYRRQYLEMSRAPDGAVKEESVQLAGTRSGASLALYRPADLARPASIVLYLHGGGFVLGDSVAYSRQSGRIALECDTIVAFLDYRRAPEHPFPAALDDTLLAIRWIVDHASGIGADLGRFALMGDSAGGNLAIAAMLHHRRARLFKCATLLYPVVDMRPYVGRAEHSLSDRDFASGYYLERPAMEYFAGAYLPTPARADDPRVSPVLAADLSGLPPVLVFGGEIDLLRDQGRCFAERLKPPATRCITDAIPA